MVTAVLLLLFCIAVVTLGTDMESATILYYTEDVDVPQAHAAKDEQPPTSEAIESKNASPVSGDAPVFEEDIVIPDVTPSAPAKSVYTVDEPDIQEVSPASSLRDATKKFDPNKRAQSIFDSVREGL